MNKEDWGWIKLYRCLLDDPDWYNGKPFDKGKAWVDLLLRVNRKQGEVDIQKEYKQVERGQVLTSKRGLSKDWNRNYRTINRWLNGWKMSGKIQHKSDRDIEHGYTLITINNWDKYQRVDVKSTAQNTAQSTYKQEYKVNKLNTPYKVKDQVKEVRYLKDLPLDKQKEVEIW